MTHQHKLALAGKTAVIAALMSGSSLVWAQDATTPAAPAPTPAAESAFAPPPVVRTLPTENDVVNPAAAEQAAQEKVVKQAPKPASAPPARVRSDAPARPTAAVAPDPVSVDNDATEMPVATPPQTDLIQPAASTEPAADAVAFADDSVAEQDATTGEDVTLIGGMAAALAALGIGAAFFARRRRKPADIDRATPVDAAPAFVAAQPVRETSMFQQFDRTPAPQTIIARKPVQGRSDIPVTDPLFSTPVVAGPITDPLFAPRNAVEPPITDPLFAKHDRFVGRARNPSDVEPRKPELVS
ncbi:MAG: hypothetical protein C0429_00325 [Sphingopyxis sp.]|nr:hypothetical protein [Sphingopyxis sp.]